MTNPNYRAERVGIMLASPLDEKRFHRWGSRAFAQRKLDGERSRLEYDSFQKSWCFYAAAGDCANFAVPHLVAAANASRLPKNLRLDGELYTHGLSQNDVHSIASRRTNLHPEHEALQYHCFDLIELGSQRARFNLLDSMFAFAQLPPALFRTVERYFVTDWAQTWSLLDQFEAEGYEGIILRQPDAVYRPLDPSEKAPHTTTMMKFKPRQQDVYAIVGFKEEIDIHGQPKGTLGALICETDSRPFSVGTGFSADQRAAYWLAIQDDPDLWHSGALSLLVRYQHLTGAKGHTQGVPYSPVFADIVLTGTEVD